MRIIYVIGLLMASWVCQADNKLMVPMYHLKNDPQAVVDQLVGSVMLEDSEFGLVLRVRVDGLEPGIHGFHVHENPSCQGVMKEGTFVAGGAAGSHFDPNQAGHHRGPYSEKAHLGDLPALHCNPQGQCDNTLLAPRLTLSDIINRSLIIHAAGDNYSDDPKPLGGGGPRVACGIIKSQ